MDKRSPWYYFIRTKTKDVAECTTCSEKIKTVGGSTSGLQSHLKSQHKINFLKRKMEQNNDIQKTGKLPVNRYWKFFFTDLPVNEKIGKFTIPSTEYRKERIHEEKIIF